MQEQRDDEQLLSHIQDLVSEEQQLHGEPTLRDTERKRLAAIRGELDQSWDLLRQRRALRGTGHDPNQAHLRPPKVVQRYIG